MSYLSPELRRLNPHLAAAVDAVSVMEANIIPVPPWAVRWWKAKNVQEREMKLHRELKQDDGSELGWGSA